MDGNLVADSVMSVRGECLSMADLVRTSTQLSNTAWNIVEWYQHNSSISILFEQLNFGSRYRRVGTYIANRPSSLDQS